MTSMRLPEAKGTEFRPLLKRLDAEFDMPADLQAGAVRVVTSRDLRVKVALAYRLARAWFQSSLARRGARPVLPPPLPGRPDHPVLLPPGRMPRRSASGLKGRIALIHALAHIELAAVDLTFDLIARGCEENFPRSFFDNWVQVGLEEAKHFAMLADRLEALGSYYGALPDGLWQAGVETAEDLTARMALVPLVLEARGLDVTPSTINRLEASGDTESAAILKVIYRDEQKHVAFGAKWFRFLCDRERCAPEPRFHALVRKHFRGQVKGPFNDRARAEAGLTPGFYKPLMPIARQF